MSNGAGVQQLPDASLSSSVSPSLSNMLNAPSNSFYPPPDVTGSSSDLMTNDPPSGSDEAPDELGVPLGSDRNSAAATGSSSHNKRPHDGSTDNEEGSSHQGGQLSEKKLRRLEKNRLSARECRRRKREAAESLERQINILEGENLRLRLQLQVGEEAEDSSSKEQSKLTSEIDELLKSGASEVEIYATLEEFKEKYADYGKSRRSAIEFHLRNLERLLMPTQVTSIVMTAMQGGDEGLPDPGTGTATPPSDAASCHQDAASDIASVETAQSSAEADLKPGALPSSMLLEVDGGAKSLDAVVQGFPPVSPSTTMSVEESAASVLGVASGDNACASESAASESVQPLPGTGPAQQAPKLEQPKSLFQYLVRHLEVTPQQAAALKDSRFVAQELDGCLETALGVLQELRARLATTTDNLDAEFNHVRSILTPTQAAKFLVWVANNKACMHMLNELWDRVYAVAPDSPANDTRIVGATQSGPTPSPPLTERRPSRSGGDDDE
jgi:bZIP transcription factor